MKGLTFGKTILLVIGAAAFAFFSCLGALNSRTESGFAFGGAGFALGVIAMLGGLLRLLFLTLSWLFRLGNKPPENPPA